MIYWSLCWLSFFIGLIAWLEYTVFNGITLLFWVISLLFILTARTHFIEAEKDQLFFCFLFKRKKQLSLIEVGNITYSTERLIQLYSSAGNEVARFYLSSKPRNLFLAFISTHYPSIALEERLQTIEK